ncbi:MAG: nuclear transport factor 2 family protein [Colwellia sp.]|nr:nuclear transport factor 2 family protein [Colwellia sp.]
MNKVKLFSMTVAIFTFLLSTVSHAESVTGKEYQAVVETAYNYFNGAANGDQALLSKAFDLEFGHVKMITVNKETGKETIKTVPLNEFAGYFKKATKDTWVANILSVDIVDDKMAMVKLDFHTAKTHYIDYLVMYKRDNGWRIINKTFIAKKK